MKTITLLTLTLVLVAGIASVPTAAADTCSNVVDQEFGTDTCSAFNTAWCATLPAKQAVLCLQSRTGLP